MRRWVVVTDQNAQLADFKGQFPPEGLPSAEQYEVGDWIEVLINEADPRIIWRLRCVELEL